MTVELKPCPTSLKAIQPYLKIASEHDERDPIISYWCRLYSLQTALTIDKKSDEAKMFLLSLMDWLEKTKRSSQINESITSEIAAQAYIENYALKLFVWADNMDRSGNFNKNVIKSFYTGGMLMDVLTTFGELNEDLVKNRKYAKWKAAYIHNCLKNGETPVSGPVYSESDEENELNELLKVNQPKSNLNLSKLEPYDLKSQDFGSERGSSIYLPNKSVVKPTSSVQLPIQPDSRLSYEPHPSPVAELPSILTNSGNASTTDKIKLDPTLIAKAQKYCKFASSALNYDDAPEAISNLQKALILLQTGKEH